MNPRLIGFLGIGAWILFWAASVFLGALRPTYSHVVNTVSELGAVGTPYAGAWNVLGFIIPGVLLAVCGAAIANAAAEPSRLRTTVMAFFIVSGLAVAGQGVVPAEIVNGVADVTSPSTRGHFISSLVSGASWAVGVLLLLVPMKRNPKWRGLHIVSGALLVLTLAAALAFRGTLPDGLAQRIGNAFFCAWYIVMSLKLIRTKSEVVPDHSGVSRGAV